MHNLLLNPAKRSASKIPFASMFASVLLLPILNILPFTSIISISVYLGNVSVVAITPNILFLQSHPALKSSEAPAGAQVPVLEQKAAISSL